MIKKNEILLLSSIISLGLFSIFIPIDVFGVEIGHGFQNVTSTTFQTTSSTFVQVTDAILTSGNFTDTEDYLIIITAQFLASDNADIYDLELRHGSTAFDGSLRTLEPASGTEWFTYSFFTLWQPTGGQDTENIGLFVKSQSSTNFDVDQVTMVSLQVSDLASTDFQYNQDTDNFDLDTISVGAWSTAENATITWTPVNNNDVWLIGTSSQIDNPDLSDNHESGISVNSTRPNDVLSGTLISNEGEDNNEIDVFTVFRTYILSSSPQEFAEEFRNDGDDVGLRLNSQVFALRLNAFQDFVEKFVSVPTSLSNSPDFINNVANTNPFTPSAGKMFFLSSIILDGDPIPHMRMRVDIGASIGDAPETQTDDLYEFSTFQDPTEELVWQIMNMSTMDGTSAQAFVNVDANCGCISQAEDRLIVGFSMELAVQTHNPISATDTPTITDSASTSTMFSRTATDTSSLTDSTSEINHYVRIVTDTPSITDSASAVQTHNPISVTDTPTITDSATKDASFVRTATDTPSLTDSASTSTMFSRTATDTPTITDSASAVQTHNPISATDTPTITDNGIKAFTRSATDTPSLTDSGSAELIRTGTDTPSLTDSYLLEINVIDTPTITDSATKDASFVRTATDTPTNTDSATKDASFVRTATDTPTITDSTSEINHHVRIVTDTPSLTDSASAVQTHNSISVTDTPTITDNVIKAFTRSATDTPTITDSATKDASFVRTATDMPTITDSATTDASFVRTATDTPTITDSTSEINHYARTGIDTPSLTDSVSAVQTHNSISVTDTPSITDSASISTMFSRTATDTPTITDSASISTMFSRTATDTPTITDSATKDASFVRTATDTPTITDNGSTELVRTGTDTPTITDSVIVDISVFEPSGKYIWFNLAPPETDRLGGVYAFECPTGQFIYTIHTNGTVSCRVP